jgi:rhodanese-related sulfurtransferase
MIFKKIKSLIKKNKNMKNINHIEFKNQTESDTNAIIIDCRTVSEWDEGVIENALLLDLFDSQRFMDEVEKLDKDKSYYVYCRSGVRSVTACQILESVGIKNTFNLLGGIMSWQDKIVAPKN